MANPILNEKAFNYGLSNSDTDSMTISGAINKALMLSLILILSAMTSVYFVIARNPSLFMPATIVSSLGAMVLAIVMNFKKELARGLSIFYAILEGVAIGCISFIFNSVYDGIVIQAAFLTFLDLLVMLLLYKFRIIKVNDTFKSIIFGATACIGVVYLVNMIMGFFGKSIPFLHDSSPLSIGISIVIVCVASFNLLLDFNFMEECESRNMPKYFEWYTAFGLLVTLVWLYLEILKLLSKLRSRD